MKDSLRKEILMSQSNFRRILPIPDIVAFVGLALIVDIVAIIALCTKQTWEIGAIVAFSACVVGFNGVAFALFLRRWLTKPDFFTKHGTAIWTNGIKEITKELVEEALDFYIGEMVRARVEAIDAIKVLNQQPKTPVEMWNLLDPRLTLEKINEMLNGASIEFRNVPITVIWPHLGTIKAYELQWGNTMMVQWLGAISKSAFFHGLQHMVDELVLGKLPDYKHEDLLWWQLVERFNRGFGK